MNNKRLFPGPAGDINSKKKHWKSGDNVEVIQKDWNCDKLWKYIIGSVSHAFNDSVKIGCIHKRFMSFPTGWKVAFVMGVMTSIPKKQTLKAEKNGSQCVVIADETGTIEVAVDPAAALQLEGRISVGSVIALQKIGVLNLKGNLMLLCSLKNLTAVYSLRKNEETTESESNCEAATINDVIEYKFQSTRVVP